MKKSSIRQALAAVAATLVGSAVTHAAGPNKTETSILVYSERQRVRATEGNFSLSKQLKNDYALNLRLTIDGLTGATPTGASPSKYAQTVTRPSGGKTVTIPAGEFPVDEYFKDTRFSAEVGVAKPIGSFSTVSATAVGSSEHDYKSIGLALGATRDFNRRNTTIGISAAYARDVITPVGGFYPEFSEVGEELPDDSEARLARFEGRKKKVTDFVLSMTQVVDRKTLLRVNYALGRSSGYHTDPYKIFSVVQGADSTDPGEPMTSYYERRPERRSKNAVFAELRRHMLGSVTTLSYRYFWDDWDVVSHSIDAGVMISTKRGLSLLPRLRWYYQSQAKFYRPFVVDGQPLPEFMSSDSRLAAFTGITGGLSVGVPVNAASKVTVSTEYYLQRGDNSPPNDLGQPLPFDLFPKLDVVMVRVGYVHSF